jgi:NADH-quinone oxidoreductase subunit G
METVTLTIDGRQVTVEKGRTVLEAAIEHGIQIPFYCYHPALGVDGSCRVCIVRVEKMPKLQTSCSTVCADGMVVNTRTPDVIDARQAVFEFLLLNHPLDCPVCDKGGECPLQDYSYRFGRERSRTQFARRVFDGEGVRAEVDFGPTLLLNRNRCILCTRCVRFMRDIDGDAQIEIANRGHGSEIATFEEQGVRSLLSGNLMDICPVGALLTKDYHFKSRPWDNPLAADTICTLCSKGCNTTAWIRAKPEWAKAPSLIRFTPRLNPDVNGYWMCDIGRFDYHWVEGPDRLQRPLHRAENGTLQPVTWQDALATLREKLGATSEVNRASIRFLVSAHASNEELFLIGSLVERLGGDPDQAIGLSWRTSEKAQPAGTKFRVSPVDAPNVHGARDFGLIPEQTDPRTGIADVSALRREVEAGRVPALYVFDPGPTGSIGDLSWVVAARGAGTLPLLIVEGVLLSDLAKAADFVLPGTSYVEKDATYTNEQGRLQATSRVMEPPDEAMEDWQILVNLGVSLGVPFTYTTAAQVRSDIAARMAHAPGYAGITGLVFRKPVTARSWLQVSNPSERWKWDLLFQDLPPVKFKGTPKPVQSGVHEPSSPPDVTEAGFEKPE